MKLGTHIATLRKLKGITQEQLATAVGVSAPAVSKWETDTSCPDISLLCPIARALGTNVDKLLQFEEVLSKEEITKKLNEIVETARSEKIEIAESMLNNLLHTYPSDCELKYNAYMTITVFAILCPMKAREKKQKWTEKQKQLLEEIRLDGASSYWEKAVSALATIAVQDDKLEKAEQLLKELPEHANDTTMIWAQLYLKKNEPEKALEVTQRRLFGLVGRLQRCLISMMNKEMISSAEQTLEICKVYKQVADIFKVGGNTSESLFVEAYLRMGNKEEAKNSAIKMMNDFVGTMQTPNVVLFYPTFKIEEGQPVVTKETKEMLMEGLLKEESFLNYQQDEEFQIAIKKLQMDIQNCK
jgi:transcriptional regulator with XRE-family HTH domain